MMQCQQDTAAIGLYYESYQGTISGSQGPIVPQSALCVFCK